ncbi:MAG: hypothetical protein AABY22_30305 [Nanoarchaeota archaeon]
MTEERAFLLTEDENDFNLCLDEISKNEITEEEERILKISLELFARLIVFQFSRPYHYNLNEGAYVSHCINIFSTIQGKSSVLLEVKRPSEEISQYYLILLGFFEKVFARKILTSPNFYLKIAQRGLEYSNRKNIADHIYQWIEILRKMNEKYHFSTKILERIES